MSLIDPAYAEDWEQDRPCTPCAAITTHTVAGQRYGRRLVNVTAECHHCETVTDVDWDDETFDGPD